MVIVNAIGEVHSLPNRYVEKCRIDPDKYQNVMIMRV